MGGTNFSNIVYSQHINIEQKCDLFTLVQHAHLMNRNAFFIVQAISTSEKKHNENSIIYSKT